MLMDRLVELLVRISVAVARLAPRLPWLGFERWEPGRQLKILLVGYNGARNTGADVRVAAIASQIEELFGSAATATVLTLDPQQTRVYFDEKVGQFGLTAVFFRKLLKACSSHHMAILCEGSTLKSTFANALTLFYCEAAGIMRAQGKPCIAYGSEAGAMEPFLVRAVRDLCSDTYFIARTEGSLEVIEGLGLEGHLGTDTAWTFDGSRGAARAERLLREGGWDGVRPLLGVAVINPFWWPVRPSLGRLVRAAVTGDWSLHYQKWFFLSWSKGREAAYGRYLDAVADAVAGFAAERDWQPVLVGMERLDAAAVGDLAARLEARGLVPALQVLAANEDGYVISQVLERLGLLVTSRYHAQVLAMRAQVPTVSVSMDERLANMAEDLGFSDRLLLDVADGGLAAKLRAAMGWADENRVAIGARIASCREGFIGQFHRMGTFLVDFVEKRFPGFSAQGARRGEGAQR